MGDEMNKLILKPFLLKTKDHDGYSVGYFKDENDAKSICVKFSYEYIGPAVGHPPIEVDHQTNE